MKSFLYHFANSVRLLGLRIAAIMLTIAVVTQLSSCESEATKAKERNQVAAVQAKAKAKAMRLKKAHDYAVARATKTRDSLKLAQVLLQKKRDFDASKALALMTLDLGDSTCAQIKEAINKDLIEDPLVYNQFIMKMMQCRNIAWNKAHPANARVTIVHEEEGALVFDTLPVKTVEDAGEVAKKIITIGAFAKTGDPMITGVATVAGNYTVDAYVQAAKKNDPLIIIMPTIIPAKQLTKDALHLTTGVYKAVTKIDPLKVFTVQIDGTKVALIGAKAAVGLAKAAPGAVVDAGGAVINVIGDGLKAAEGVMPWHW